jgi:hypothetical protein
VDNLDEVDIQGAEDNPEVAGNQDSVDIQAVACHIQVVEHHSPGAVVDHIPDVVEHTHAEADSVHAAVVGMHDLAVGRHGLVGTPAVHMQKSVVGTQGMPSSQLPGGNPPNNEKFPMEFTLASAPPSIHTPGECLWQLHCQQMHLLQTWQAP